MNRWVELKNPPRTVQEAFGLTDRIELQIQLADSFKQELYNDFPSLDVNKISAEETSGDENEVNEMSHGRKWGNNNSKNN